MRVTFVQVTGFERDKERVRERVRERERERMCGATERGRERE